MLSIGCGIADYIPTGPTLSDRGAAQWLAASRVPVPQDGAPPSIPIPPFQPFAVHYQADIVVESRDPTWQMHEFARVGVGGETYWLAKDSDHDGVQTVTADLPDIETWLPEVPIPRQSRPVTVADRSTPERLEIELDWTTPTGQQAALAFSARHPTRDEWQRNSSTFNHSHRAVSVLLDVRRKRLNTRATIAFDGASSGVRRLLGLVPVKALLVQTQAGIAAASMHLAAEGAELVVTRPHAGVPWPTRGVERWAWDGAAGTGSLSHASAGSRWVLAMVDGGLAGLTVHVEELGATPALEVALSAPLPDPTRPFEGVIERAFVARVNGLLHGHGTVVARREGSDTVVELLPAAPRWFADRPVRSTISPSEGGWRLESRVGGHDPPLSR